jgi:hypothetical protein
MEPTRRSLVVDTSAAVAVMLAESGDEELASAWCAGAAGEL